MYTDKYKIKREFERVPLRYLIIWLIRVQAATVRKGSNNISAFVWLNKLLKSINSNSFNKFSEQQREPLQYINYVHDMELHAADRSFKSQMLSNGKPDFFLPDQSWTCMITKVSEIGELLHLIAHGYFYGQINASL